MTIQSMNPAVRRFEIRNVLGNMGRAVGQNWVVFLGLALLLQGVPMAVVGYVQYSRMGGMLQPGAVPRDLAEVGRLLAISGVGVLVSIISSSVLQASLIFGVMANLLGRRTSFGECLAGGLRHFPRALGIAIVTIVAIFVVVIVGSILIVPGIVIGTIMALAWCVSVPVAVSEDKGVFASIGRSASLTNGYKGQIFLLFLIYFGVYTAFSTLASAIGGPFLATNLMIYYMVLGVVVGPIMAAVASVFGAAGIAATYYELRSSREGVGVEEMASVFE